LTRELTKIEFLQLSSKLTVVGEPMGHLLTLLLNLKEVTNNKGCIQNLVLICIYLID